MTEVGGWGGGRGRVSGMLGNEGVGGEGGAGSWSGVVDLQLGPG